MALSIIAKTTRPHRSLRCAWDSISNYFHRNNMGKKLKTTQNYFSKQLQNGSPITIRFRLYCSYSIKPFE